MAYSYMCSETYPAWLLQSSPFDPSRDTALHKKAMGLSNVKLKECQKRRASDCALSCILQVDLYHRKTLLKVLPFTTTSHYQFLLEPGDPSGLIVQQL